MSHPNGGPFDTGPHVGSTPDELDARLRGTSVGVSDHPQAVGGLRRYVAVTGDFAVGMGWQGTWGVPGGRTVAGASNELERQIEAAFDYRGHVAITLKSGECVGGYVYNRQFAHRMLQEPPFIEVFLAGSGDGRKFAIELTGKDYAATGPSSHEMAAAESPDPSAG
jgi:hypothetical protein